MSALNTPRGDQAFVDEALSTGTTVSKEIDMPADVTSASIQVILTDVSALTGSIVITGSNGMPELNPVFSSFGATATDIADVLAEANDSLILTILSGAPRRIRIEMVVTGGTGVVNAFVNGRS